MTDTQVEISFQKACSNVVPNQVLGMLTYEKMVELGPPKYTEQERDYIKRYHQVVGEQAVLEDDGAVPHYDMDTRRRLVREHPMADFILPYQMVATPGTGSSDIGDVSQIAPLIQIETACFSQGSTPHSWHWVTQGLSSYAMKGTLFAGQIMTEVAKELFEKPELLERAKEELRERMDGKSYECPIPEDVFPPVGTGGAKHG